MKLSRPTVVNNSVPLDTFMSVGFINVLEGNVKFKKNYSMYVKLWNVTGWLFLSNIRAEEFVGVDLHVHTPASHCYKGEKSNAEYLEILRRYCEKNIKLIAITDHNTIKGYLQLLELKREISEKINVLKPYAEQYPDLKIELQKLESNYELFESICILPGVEFEATPGIHLLFIFDPTSDPSRINQLLLDAGYTTELQGREVLDIPANMDVIKAITEANSLGAIVIAAHADSNKGIYNDLKPGNYRAQVFKSSCLIGISYKSANSREKMEAWLQNDEYKRREPIAFIQSSDYHGGSDDPGASITYLKLETFNFSSVCAALKNPNQCVSATVRPEIADIIKKIIDDPSTVAFENINESYFEDIKKVLCAILNRGFGTIVFGVKPDSKNIVGLNQDGAEVKRLIDASLSSINPEFPTFVSFTTEYKYGSKIVSVIRLKSTIDVIYHLKDNRTFLFKNKNLVYEATPNELLHISNDAILKRVSEFQSLYDKKFSKVLLTLDLIRESSQQFVLVNKIESNSLKFADVFNINMIKPYDGVAINFEELSSNGDADGDVFLVDRNLPRLQYAYLRYSVPRYKNLNLDKLGLKKINGNAIIMTPGGAVYYVENDNQEWGLISLDHLEPTLIMTIKKEFVSYFSEESIVAWLKSSLFLWYCYVAFGSLNPHKPKRILKLPIPNVPLLKKDSILNQKVKNIIKLELELLSEVSKYTSEGREVAVDLITQHNENIGNLAAKIDEQFFNTFDLTSDNKQTIRSCFELKDLFFGVKKDNSEEMSAHEEIKTYQNDAAATIQLIKDL